MTVHCELCRREIDPSSPHVVRRVVGWERKASSASRRSGSDIVLREHIDEYACSSCVTLLQSGIAPGQASLL